MIIKALLAHGASWGPTAQVLKEAIQDRANGRLREYLARFLGYGTVDPVRSMSASDERATLIGWNLIREKEAFLHSLPLPPSLSRRTDWRRLTVTLAWLTPINPAHRAYRRAHLWFDAPSGALVGDRAESDANAAKRGTLQHEVFDGERACLFVDGDEIAICVSCRQDGGAFSEPIRYAIIVSLEVREGVGLPIYAEIEERVRLRVPAVRIGAS